MDENNCAGLVRAAFTPLSRFPVKRLNGCRLSSRQRERRSFLASSLSRIVSRWEEEALRITEKKKKGRGEKKGWRKEKRREREKNREGRIMLWRIIGTWDENPRLSWANLLNYLIVEYLVDRHDVELISISLLPILGRPSQFPDKELGKYCRLELLISSSPFTTSA